MHTLEICQLNNKEIGENISSIFEEHVSRMK